MNHHNVGQAPPANNVGQAVPDDPTAKLTRTERRQAQPDLRALLVAFLAAAFSTTATAGVRHIEDEENTGHIVIKMEVTPADEPSPVFEHRLTYGPHERISGNRPQWYTRAFPEKGGQWKVWEELTAQDSFGAYYQSGVPVDEVAWENLDVSGKSCSQMFLDNYVVPGAQRRDCDWGIHSDQVRGPEFFQILLPEFQSMRSFARMLNLQVRLAIHERRYGDAVKFLRTQYQLGVDVAEEPIIVCGLIGVAIAGIGNSGAADLMAAPNSPNLYWALSELPAVPVSMGPALRKELSISHEQLGGHQESVSSARLPEEWNSYWKSGVASAAGLTFNFNSSPPRRFEFLQQVAPLAIGLHGYSHAKQRLIAWGFDANEVEAMAVGQVLSLYSARVSQLRTDLYMKTYLAPYSFGRSLQKEASAYLTVNRHLAEGPDRELTPFASDMLSVVRAVRTAEMRAARDLAALRVIEALRMHAARNDSRWPDSLDDVTCVPVPLNPATDKPFLYHRDGETAVLELPESEGFPGYSRRYEITIAKP
jgi:hypothetical protein